MATRQPIQDDITAAVLSDSAYERLRLTRITHFRGTLPAKLRRLTGLLIVLASVFPLYLAYPASTAAYLPSSDPRVAAPRVLILGVFGGAMVSVAAVTMVAVGYYRLRQEPVTERQAETMLDLETAASYVGFVTGGVAVSLTVAYFLLGLGGAGAFDTYASLTGGINPFDPGFSALTVEAVAVAAVLVALPLLVVTNYLDVQFDRLRVQSLGSGSRPV